MTMRASDWVQHDHEAFERLRQQRERAWRERSAFCSCPGRSVPTRKYWRMWVCAVCNGFIH